MAHTSGPWVAEYSMLDVPGWRVKSVRRQSAPYDAYPMLRANLAYSGEAEAAANARLIAAAPDYWNAAEQLVADADELHGDDAGYIAVPKDAYAALMAAHRKASGLQMGVRDLGTLDAARTWMKLGEKHGLESAPMREMEEA